VQAAVALEARPSVKGLAFRTVMNELAVARGPLVGEWARAAMPAELRDAITMDGVVTNGWYPVGWYRAMWRAICDASEEGAQLVRLLGRRAVHADASSLHRAVLRLVSPSTLTRTGARYFNRIYDTGGIRIVTEERHRIVARFVGCSGFDRNMWVEIAGSIEGIFELAGMQGVSVMITDRGHDDDDEAVYVARWS
jgi:hypothetical protein